MQSSAREEMLGGGSKYCLSAFNQWNEKILVDRVLQIGFKREDQVVEILTVAEKPQKSRCQRGKSVRYSGFQPLSPQVAPFLLLCYFEGPQHSIFLILLFSNCTLLYCIIVFYIISYYSILYILYYIILYYSILYNIILYYIIL